jgi:hypothetical protein
MPQNHPLKPNILQMLRANFSSVGSHSIIGAVLGSNMIGDIFISLEIEDSRDVEEDGRDYNVDIVVVVLEVVDSAVDEGLCLFEGEVGLPVTGDHAFVAAEGVAKQSTGPHKI